MDYKNKYIKYKTKYLELKNINVNSQIVGGNDNYKIIKDIDVNNQIGGGGKNTKPKLLIIMCMFHSKNDYQKGHNVNIDLKSMIISLKKKYDVYLYYTKFHLPHTDAVFSLNDMKLENVALDIHKQHPGKKYILGIESGSAYALYYSKQYANYCKGLLCFPLRGYTKYALERRIYKYKDNGGWERSVSKTYNIDDYFININNKRLQEIITKRKNEEEKTILMLVVDLELRKQYEKLPEIFTIPTTLFIRLDLDKSSFLERNLNNEAVSAMKKNFTEKDAIFESCFGSMSKVEWCDKLLKKNPKNLMIHYLPHQDNKFYDYGQYIVKSLKN